MSATVEAAAAMPRSAGSRWALTILVAAAIFINYIDRGNLATRLAHSTLPSFLHRSS